MRLPLGVDPEALNSFSSFPSGYAVLFYDVRHSCSTPSISPGCSSPDQWAGKHQIVTVSSDGRYR